MLNTRRKSARNARWSQPVYRPAMPVRADKREETTLSESVTRTKVSAKPTKGLHPLTNQAENQRLNAYEQNVKSAFDAIVPTLKRISAIQHDADFSNTTNDQKNGSSGLLVLGGSSPSFERRH